MLLISKFKKTQMFLSIFLLCKLLKKVIKKLVVKATEGTLSDEIGVQDALYGITYRKILSENINFLVNPLRTKTKEQETIFSLLKVEFQLL